jgi:hypothetical protein
MKTKTHAGKFVTITLRARPVIAWATYGGDMNARAVVADFGAYEDNTPPTIFPDPYGEDGEERVLIPATPGYYQLLVVALGCSTREDRERGVGQYLVGLERDSDWPNPVVAAASIEEALRSEEADRIGAMYVEIAQDKYPGATVTYEKKGLQ